MLKEKNIFIGGFRGGWGRGPNHKLLNIYALGKGYGLPRKAIGPKGVQLLLARFVWPSVKYVDD